VSDDQSGTPGGEPTQAYPPPPYPPEQRSGVSGWLIALGVVTVLALGGIAAALISTDDSGSSGATSPAVTVNKTAPSTTTTVQSTTTVTTPAPNVTVAPSVTLDPSGSVGTVQSGAKTPTATSP
jgi:hypothetical protein